MTKYNISQKAKNDLIKIENWSKDNFGKEKAKIYLYDFNQSFEQISKMPKIGKDCSHLIKNGRAFVLKSHLIFYKEISPNSIKILRILNQNQDIQRIISQ